MYTAPSCHVIAGSCRSPVTKRSPIGLLLVQLVLVELPDAAVRLEQRARILPHDPLLPVFGLTRIRRRSEVDIQRSLAVKRDALVVVLVDASYTVVPVVDTAARRYRALPSLPRTIRDNSQRQSGVATLPSLKILEG